MKTNNKIKHINIRVNPELNTKINNIQKEMEKFTQVKLARSQVIEMLISKGIEKYISENMYPYGD